MTAAQHPGSTSLLPLVATDVVRTFGDRVVLDGVGLVAHPGQPVGLVGENGVGKSTLLRILAGLDRPDAGTVSAPVDLAYLGQEAEMDPGATVGEVLHAALAPLHQAVARLEGLAARLSAADPATAAEYAAALAWAEHHDAWDADRRAELAAAHLGLAAVDRDRPVASLSGGERSRLALAAVVTRRPDAVLLDEPTNHLDDDAMAFLEDFLAACPGVVVVASHDRVFLDRVAQVVVDLDPSWFGADGRGGDRYTGDVTAYLAAKRAARRRWEQAFLAQREEIEALRVAAATTARRTAPGRGPRDGDKMAYDFKTGTVQRSVARRVRDVERRLDAVEAHRVPKPPRPLRLSARMAKGAGRVRVRGLVVPGRVRVDRLDLARGSTCSSPGRTAAASRACFRSSPGRSRPARATCTSPPAASATCRRTLPSSIRGAPPRRCMPRRSVTGRCHRCATWVCCTRGSWASRWGR